MKVKITGEDQKYQTTGEEKTRNQKVTLIQLHNQTLKQQKQLNDRKHHIPININTECQRTQLPQQKTLLGKLD
jgi:hypothetical protein